MTQAGENPGRGGADRVLDIAATAKQLDSQDLTEAHLEYQSETMAVASVMRRFHVSVWHAQTICRLSGLGGRA